jgi:hypothetical protein
MIVAGVVAGTFWDLAQSLGVLFNNSIVQALNYVNAIFIYLYQLFPFF